MMDLLSNVPPGIFGWNSPSLESLYEMVEGFPKAPPMPELPLGYRVVEAKLLPETVSFAITGPGGSVFQFKDGRVLSMKAPTAEDLIPTMPESLYPEFENRPIKFVPGFMRRG